MHDLKDIRDNPDAFDAGLSRRGLAPRAGEILALDEEARKFTYALNELQARRNALSKEIGAAKAKGDEAAFKKLMAEVDEAKAQMPVAEEEQKRFTDQITAILETLPNLPAKDAPQGASEHDNVEIRKWGEPRRLNAAKEHFDLGEALGLMDFETAAAMSGARFVLLKGQLARLERAIANFMLDLHTGEFGYTECSPPLLVRDEALYGTGQLPKFERDLFKTLSFDQLAMEHELSRLEETMRLYNEDARQLSTINRELELLSDLKAFKLRAQDFDRISSGLGKRGADIDSRLEALKQLSADADDPHWLIPTAEVPLTNTVREKILDADELPLRLTAWTQCFRSEAGAAGKDTRGMIRMHQFSKVELVSITAPDKSDEEHERMTSCAEEVLKRLDLPFRTIVLCTGDMGFSARKTYDIEVWLPGQNRYREISSCSNCGDFQARRMKTRFKAKGDKQTQFVNTLNGSGLAVGRTLVAILENYQDTDGSVAVPDVLKPYMGGVEKIVKR